MGRRQSKLWLEASELAYRAMGTRRARRLDDMRRFEPEHVADQDPLAWWCLTEAIVGIAERYRYGENRDAG